MCVKGVYMKNWELIDIMNYIRAAYHFFMDIISNRTILWELTKKDLIQRYIGSYLGILWAFIQPSISVIIYIVVFQIGFKTQPVNNVPCALWLCCGMFPWFFLSAS